MAKLLKYSRLIVAGVLLSAASLANAIPMLMFHSPSTYSSKTNILDLDIVLANLEGSYLSSLPKADEPQLNVFFAEFAGNSKAEGFSDFPGNNSPLSRMRFSALGGGLRSNINSDVKDSTPARKPPYQPTIYKPGPGQATPYATPGESPINGSKPPINNATPLGEIYRPISPNSNLGKTNNSNPVDVPEPGILTLILTGLVLISLISGRRNFAGQTATITYRN